MKKQETSEMRKRIYYSFNGFGFLLAIFGKVFDMNVLKWIGLSLIAVSLLMALWNCLNAYKEKKRNQIRTTLLEIVIDVLFLFLWI